MAHVGNDAVMQVCKTRIQPCNQTSNARDGTKDTSKAKALQPTSDIIHRHLNNSTCRDSVPHHAFKQKEKNKTTLKDKGVRLDLVGLYGAGPGRPNGSRETEQVTCTLEVHRWGESRRLSPRQLA